MNKFTFFDKNSNGDIMKQNINCNVHDCKHCNKENSKCLLDEIKICSCGDENKKENTMCNNYKKEN